MSDTPGPRPIGTGGGALPGLKLTNIIAILNWIVFTIILLCIVSRVVPSDPVSWLGLAIAAIVAIGAGLTGAILDGARRKRGGQ